MFIVSGPELVIAQCKSGIVGAFPALNARPQDMLDEWLVRIKMELAEFSARIPPDLLMAGGQIRRFYKDAFRGFLPNEILTKEKHGFGLPYMAIMKKPGPLQDLVCDALSGLASRGYFRRSFIDGQIQGLRGDSAADEVAVAVAWDLASLELWFQSRSIR